jgi:hypothetical protein
LAKPKTRKKKRASRPASSRFWTACLSERMGWPLRRFALARSSGVSDSGSLNVATRHAVRDRRAAATPGAQVPTYLPSGPPSAGPSTKPRPKAIPIMPMPFARFSFVVTSAT